MDTIAKKGRFYLLAAAILAYLAAVGVVANQIVSVVLSNIVTDNLGAVLGLYNQFAAVVGAVFTGAAPCILLLLARRQMEGKSKAGLAFLACGAGLSAILTGILFFVGSAEASYAAGMISAAVSGVLCIVGDILIAADRQNSGTVKGIAIAASIFALLTAGAKIAANLCGYNYLLTYANDPWIMLLRLASACNLFASIIGCVLDGSKFMLLFALPTVKPAVCAAEPTESKPQENETP